MRHEIRKVYAHGTFAAARALCALASCTTVPRLPFCCHRKNRSRIFPPAPASKRAGLSHAGSTTLECDPVSTRMHMRTARRSLMSCGKREDPVHDRWSRSSPMPSLRARSQSRAKRRRGPSSYTPIRMRVLRALATPGVMYGNLRQLRTGKICR